MLQRRANARAWLADAGIGYCATTQPGANADCTAGESGNFFTYARHLRSWVDMADDCLRRCARCNRCNYVSMAVSLGECSWFSVCPIRSLNTTAHGTHFRSGKLAGAWRAALLTRSGEAPERDAASPRAREWHARARRGYCAVTTGEADCGTGQQGVLAPAVPDALYIAGWNAAASACLAACDACARCRYVSVSLKHRDCSWFHSCDLDALKTGVPGFRSAPVAERPHAQPPGNAQLATRRLVVVTISYPHLEQAAKLRHCLRRLLAGVEGPALHWVIVEDANATTPSVARLLTKSGIAHTHAAVGPSRAKGHVQRNLAYRLIRDQQLGGVVYNVR
jgi:hypothetical protein